MFIPRQHYLTNSSRQILKAASQVRRISLTLTLHNDEKQASPTKRVYNKRVTDDQLTDVLKKAPKLIAHKREIDLLGDDDDNAVVTKRPYQKVDKSYRKDLNKVVNIAEKKVRNDQDTPSTKENAPIKSAIRDAVDSINRSKTSLRDKRKMVDIAKNTNNSHDYFQKTTGSNKDSFQNTENSHSFVNENNDKNMHSFSSSKKNTRDYIMERLTKSGKGSIFSKNVRPIGNSSRTFRQLSRNKKHHTNSKVKERTRRSRLVKSELIAVDSEQLLRAKEVDISKIPTLAHDLDRVLFSPGVHFLQDPRTRIYNFPPVLKRIIKYEDFNFAAVGAFQRVSKDNTLLNVCKENDKQFYSSTSSMTSTLMQFYFLLNNFSLDSAKFASRFGSIPFTGLMTQLPASLIVSPRGKNSEGKTIYSIESDKSYDNEILLSAMGHCLETFLTTDPEKFKEYNINYDGEMENPRSVYNYSKYGKFLMRSQLDCSDHRLPRKTFDLKTRAVCSIRYDGANPDLENNQYQIWRLNGEYESFEREYNDLIRTGALMKYMFQARIGQMDGIFVAYHNINTFFGFQYLPLEELDNVFYNHESFETSKHTDPNLLEVDPEEVDLSKLSEQLPSYVGETQFKMTLSIWESLLEEVTNAIGEDKAFRLVLKSERRTTRTKLKVFAVPFDQKEINELQDFPSQFQTSFRDKLSTEQRLKNLMDHRDKLFKFNSDSVARKIVHSYCLVIDDHVIGGKSSTEEFPMPKKVGQDWKVQYSLLKYESDDPEVNRAKYLDLLKLPTEAIAAGFERSAKSSNEADKEAPKEKKKMTREEILKVYSKIGHARASQWSTMDSTNTQYKPLVKK
ncbi:uncharacterized protein RJT20DRAFT_24942 [Scheffersomyces xylosifermentans]|uniref:uncharacterized protein n=1 Tax=Scheffersomyces xylosifermentans TaxID=1304137 RepID=UPI00315DCD9F